MKKILLVDDEKTYVMSLSEGLRHINGSFNVLTAEDGEQAIKILKSANVDLLLTDLKMPVMDGFELLTYVLKTDPHMPVIVMTAFTNPDVLERLRKMGFSNYIEKPLEFDELVYRIRNLLNEGGNTCRQATC